MSVASMAARLKRLEKQAVGRTGVAWPFKFDPLTKCLYSEPSPEDFAVMAYRQQTELQATFARMMADLADPTDAPANVGKPQQSPKPDGFTFDYNGEELVVVKGEAKPFKIKQMRN